MSSLLQSPNKNDRPSLNLEEMLSEDEARRRREQLERRPSYRMILKDIAAAADNKPLKKEVEDLADRSTASGGLLGPPSGNSVVHFEVPTTAHLSNGTRTNSAATDSSSASSAPTPVAAAPAPPPPPSLRVSSAAAAANSAAAAAAVSTLASAVMRNNQQQQQQQTDAHPPADPLTARLLGQPVRSTAVSDIPSQPQPQLQQLGLANGLLLPVSQDLLNLKPTDSISLSAAAAATSAAAGMPNFSQGNGYSNNARLVTEWSSGLLSQYNAAGNGHSPLAAPQLANRQGSASLTSLSDNDESNRKRQVRLLKNREAAKECRRKKKEYVKCLENRVAVLENQNKALIDELKALKEMYCRKEKSEMN